MYGTDTRSYNRSTEKRQMDRERAEVTKNYVPSPEGVMLSVLCTCRSFRYPHELSMHRQLRSEADWRIRQQTGPLSMSVHRSTRYKGPLRHKDLGTTTARDRKREHVPQPETKSSARSKARLQQYSIACISAATPQRDSVLNASQERILGNAQSVHVTSESIIEHVVRQPGLARPIRIHA